MRPGLRIVLGFIALALLNGAVSRDTFSPFAAAMHWQILAGGALTSLLAAIVLLLASAARRQRLLTTREWLVLLLLLLPQWVTVLLGPSYIESIPWLHATRWGVAFLLMLAAPLWLGLLSALRLVQIEVPRAVAAAGIAGIGAVCLVVPMEAYGVAANEVPMLLMHLQLSIAIVFNWAYASPQLASVGALAAAGSFLLLEAMGGAALSLLLERHAWQPIDWHAIVFPLLVQTVVVGASLWLWFWLLQRMSPPAFCMHPLAAWAASMLPGFAIYGLRDWRVDAAVALAVVSLTVALQARVVDEQPLRLSLHSR